mgnify:CR=1 FL=1
MAYVNYSTHWSIDNFLTYLESNQLGANDEHLYNSFAVEHNINTATVDGTHKANSITGSSINTTPASTSSQAILGAATWTPTAGVYQIVGGQVPSNSLILQIFVSGSWRGSYVADTSPQNDITGINFFDGTNMRVQNTETSDTNTVWYQKF